MINESEISPYSKGERGLIASIINQSIVDGCSIKHPRPSALRNKERDKLTIKKQRALLVSCHKLLSAYLKKTTKKKRFPYYIFFLANKIEILKTGEAEEIAWSARVFIDDKNKLFCFYCDLLDMCPTYLSKKIHDYFHKIDDGIYKRCELIA
jgi:hypothetical protein